MNNELDALQGLVTTATGFVVAYGFQLLGAVIILAIGIHVAKWVAGLVVKFCDRKGLDITLSRFFGSVTKVGILVFVVIIALGKFGITIAPFIAALGAVAFGSSLAIQGPLSNYGAGLSIILGRPFVVGNTITVQGVSGIVEEVRLAATILRTEDGEEITIPNKQVVGEILLNSFANKIVETSIGISYDDDAEQAIAVIRQVLDGIDEVSSDPAPQIGIADFGDSSLNIGMRYWVPTEKYFELRFATNQAVYRAVKTAKITIPYPKREVELITGGSSCA